MQQNNALDAVAFLERLHAAARQFIGAFVFGMSGMALHPMQRDLMPVSSLFQLLPQFGILHGFLSAVFPAVFLQPKIHLLIPSFT